MKRICVLLVAALLGCQPNGGQPSAPSGVAVRGGPLHGVATPLVLPAPSTPARWQDGVWVTLGTIEGSGPMVPIESVGVSARITGDAIEAETYGWVTGQVYASKLLGAVQFKENDGNGDVTIDVVARTGELMIADTGESLRFAYDRKGETLSLTEHPTADLRKDRRMTMTWRVVMQREDAARRSNYASLSLPTLLSLAQLQGIRVGVGKGGAISVEPEQANPTLAAALRTHTPGLLKRMAPAEYEKQEAVKQLLGTWMAAGVVPNKPTYVVTFKADGTATVTTKDPDRVGNALAGIFVGDMYHTWSVTGDKLLMRSTGANGAVAKFGAPFVVGSEYTYGILGRDKTHVWLRPVLGKGGPLGEGTVTHITLTRQSP